MPYRKHGLVWAAACALIAAFAAPAHALSDQADTAPWTPNGPVKAIAHHDGTTYIGGDFNYVGPPTGSALALSKADASILSELPEFAGGNVYALEPDGSGGWYAGGGFTHIGGAPHKGLAHINADGTLDPALDLNPTGRVYDIELNSAGTRLFVSGDFGQIGGETRNRLASIALPANTVEAWNPDMGFGFVYDMELHPNEPTNAFIYVGGQFTTVGGVLRPNFAEINITTGAATGAYTAGANATVTTIETAGDATDPTIYLGGLFTQVLAVARNGLAALQYSNLVTPTAWDPNLTRDPGAVAGFAWDLDVAGVNVYVAGFFHHVGAADRNHVAAISTSGTGTAAAWNPNPAGAFGNTTTDARAIAVDGTTVYVGGNFSSIGGAARNGVAAIDGTTGNATAWDANVGGEPQVVEADGSAVVVGGAFSSAKGVHRSSAAALDSSGAATAWNPHVAPGQEVHALAVAPDGGTVYIGGNFGEVGSEPRSSLAAVDAAGALKSWDPSPSNDVNALQVSPDGQTVFAGGQFSTIGGQPRDYLAAVDAGSGIAGAWNPQPDGNVHSLLLAPGGNRLLVGGDFNNVGSTPISRDYIAAFDVGSDAPTAWNPVLDGKVLALATSPDGSTVYAGGEFGNVGTTVRNRIAGIDAASGAPTAFDPDSDENIRALAVSPDGSKVYAGGQHRDTFTTSSIGGATARSPVELDAVTGAATSWNPGGDDYVSALVMAGPDLLVGGEFLRMSGRAHQGFAAFRGPVPPAPDPGPGSETPVVPPPAVPAGDLVRPVITALSMTNSTFSVGPKPTAVSAATRRRRTPVGTRFRWTLSEPAKARIAIQRELPGLKLGRRCLRATRANRRRVIAGFAKQLRGLTGARRARKLRALLRKRRCTALKAAGTLNRTGVQGRNVTPFSGRIGRRALAKGRYRAVFTATDAAGNRSAVKRVRFRVVRPAPRRR